MNDREISIEPYYYNIAKRQKDNVYKIDTKNRYIGFNVTIRKNYQDCEKEEMVQLLINDLRSIADELEKNNIKKLVK